eukprot:XP_023158088.1 HVA22-like protein i [Zea mays]
MVFDGSAPASRLAASTTASGIKMIGSFITGMLTLVLGYAYPAYDCYKTVELNRPEVEQLRFWCQYWILLAFLTVLERVGESFVSWLPMYSGSKARIYRVLVVSKDRVWGLPMYTSHSSSHTLQNMKLRLIEICLS